MLSATEKGHGISLQTVAAAKPLIASGELVGLLTEWEPKPLGVYVVYANRKYVTPLERAFIDFLAEEMKSSPNWQSI